MTEARRRILILDDDPETLRLLTAYLRAPHVDLVACSEIEAAECLMDRQRFDVLVTDLEVSDLGGLEGIRLIRHVACNFPGTDVIVFSGKIDESVRTLGRALGVVELLEKPEGLNRLRESAGVGLSAASAPPRNGTGTIGYVETLDEILRSRCITAVLQPIISLEPAHSSATAFGVEGLSRGPEGSLLRNPEILLDYSSRKERLFEAELQCIEAVLVESCQLPGLGRLFINTSPRSLSTPDFVGRLRDLVRQHGYCENDIVLELTEQQSIINLRAFDATLDSLRGYGFGLALDDYGSGFANLHLVQQLSLDYVKIDGYFCNGIASDSRKQAIVGSTVDMTRKLGISTIMERVETEEELKVVRRLGVDYAQGYYFSAPLPGSELAAWFQPAAPTASTVATSTELPAGSSRGGLSYTPSGPWPIVQGTLGSQYETRK
ncbi:MAG: EAL domain-containing protein [bacterium]|nr:EAL domain-containing protein [bacterium]